MTKPQITGLAACAAMAFSVFMPILTAPNASLSLMSNNEVQAIIVLILTAATAAGFYFRRPIITMLASLLNLLFVCFLLFIYVGAKANPEPGEFSQIMLMSFSWGWLVILGASLVMAVASFKTRSERKVEASNVST